MPGYRTHARWGRIGAAVIAIVAASAVYTVTGRALLAGIAAAVSAVAAFVGAVYPDVDHHESIPRRKAVRAFRAVVAVAAAGFAVANWPALTAFGTSLGSGLPPAAVAGGLTVVAGAVAVALVDPVLGLATGEHRSWTHSVTVNFALLSLVAAGVWLATPDIGTDARLVAVGLVGTFFLGSLVHLGLDGELF